MPDIGVPELLLILVVVLLLFGPSRLPEVGAALGAAMRALRQELQGKGKHRASEESDRREDNQ